MFNQKRNSADVLQSIFKFRYLNNIFIDVLWKIILRNQKKTEKLKIVTKVYFSFIKIEKYRHQILGTVPKLGIFGIFKYKKIVKRF